MEQVSIHIATMIQFRHQQNDPTVQLLWANAKAFQLQASLGSQIFHLPLAISKYLTKLWFTSTWWQCQLLDIIITTDIADFQPQCQNNKEVMHSSSKWDIEAMSSRH